MTEKEENENQYCENSAERVLRSIFHSNDKYYFHAYLQDIIRDIYFSDKPLKAYSFINNIILSSPVVIDYFIPSYSDFLRMYLYNIDDIDKEKAEKIFNNRYNLYKDLSFEDNDYLLMLNEIKEINEADYYVDDTDIRI